MRYIYIMFLVIGIITSTCTLCIASKPRTTFKRSGRLDSSTVVGSTAYNNPSFKLLLRHARSGNPRPLRRSDIVTRASKLQQRPRSSVAKLKLTSSHSPPPSPPVTLSHAYRSALKASLGGAESPDSPNIALELHRAFGAPSSQNTSGRIASAVKTTRDPPLALRKPTVSRSSVVVSPVIKKGIATRILQRRSQTSKRLGSQAGHTQGTAHHRRVIATSPIQ